MTGEPKSWVVEDVKEVGTGLKREVPVEFEFPAQRQIDLGGAESVQDIAAESSQQERECHKK